MNAFVLGLFWWQGTSTELSQIISKIVCVRLRARACVRACVSNLAEIQGREPKRAKLPGSGARAWKPPAAGAAVVGLGCGCRVSAYLYSRKLHDNNSCCRRCGLTVSGLSWVGSERFLNRLMPPEAGLWEGDWIRTQPSLRMNPVMSPSLNVLLEAGPGWRKWVTVGVTWKRIFLSSAPSCLCGSLDLFLFFWLPRSEQGRQALPQWCFCLGFSPPWNPPLKLWVPFKLWMSGIWSQQQRLTNTGPFDYYS